MAKIIDLSQAVLIVKGALNCGIFKADPLLEEAIEWVLVPAEFMSDEGPEDSEQIMVQVIQSAFKSTIK